MTRGVDEPPYPGWPGPDTSKPKERDERGRMIKGSSGNWNGRPKKAVRPFTSDQFLREVISELERPIEINGENVTATTLLIRQTIRLALKGDRHASQMVKDWQVEIWQTLRRKNPEENRSIEILEKHIKEVGLGPEKQLREMLNEAYRKAKDL